MIRRLRDAIEKTRYQRRHPNEVGPAVHSMDAIGLLFGRGDKTMLSRMKATREGRALLEARHDVLSLIADRDTLRQLPDGSLGREYCRFAEDNGLFPEILAKEVREARSESGGFVPESTPEAAYLHDRYRDLHDLWHVLTGYGTDMAGEWGIIAFQTKQVGYRSMTTMAFMNVVKMTLLTGRFDFLSIWFKGRRRGKRAKFLLAEDWERLLPMPLEEVRQELGVEPLAPYRPWNYPVPNEAPAQAA